MAITEAQRFFYSLLALATITIFVLVLLNVYALEVFLVLMVAEFCVVVELTNPRIFQPAWRKYIAIFLVMCLIVFLVVFYYTALPSLG